MALALNTILILVILGVLVGILFALRRMYSLERKMAKLEVMVAGKRIPKKKIKRRR